jgi:hypothetical protein
MNQRFSVFTEHSSVTVKNEVFHMFENLSKSSKIVDFWELEKCYAFFYTGGNEISSATKNHRFFVGIKNHRFFKIFTCFVFEGFFFSIL